MVECFIGSEESESYDEDDSEESEDEVAGLCTDVPDFLEHTKRTVKEFSNSAFTHCCGFYLQKKLEDKKNDSVFSSKSDNQTIKGIIIDTGANRSSIISITMNLSQYKTYCQTFGVRSKFKQSAKIIHGD